MYSNTVRLKILKVYCESIPKEQKHKKNSSNKKKTKTKTTTKKKTQKRKKQKSQSKNPNLSFPENDGSSLGRVYISRGIEIVF